MEFLGLTIDQLLILAGLAVVLLVVLVALKFLLKLTKTCLGLGCLGIVVLLALAFIALQAPVG